MSDSEPYAVLITAHNQAQAALYRSVLDAAGIDCIVDNETAMAFAYGETAGGITIRVRAEDRAAAEELIKQQEDEGA
jgi:hypothetical protein